MYSGEVIRGSSGEVQGEGLLVLGSHVTLHLIGDILLYQCYYPHTQGTVSPVCRIFSLSVLKVNPESWLKMCCN